MMMMAAFVNSSDALVEWNSIPIDRYDVRHLLTSPPSPRRRHHHIVDSFESELDQERYLDLSYNQQELAFKKKMKYGLKVELLDRLARLEAALATKQDSGYHDLLKKFDELKLNLEDARTLQDSEREKVLKEVQRLASENAKLQYRIIHLVRALEEADSKTTSN
ncbi:hypothetical protein POM88_025493 [Heracleum sosnowskyi]|uniref:Suppressor of white apricot N-terminal domain-containing protein n=1 Tax=Heracleum sosnowskyi TaxID=360622 RepID=A0AAD8I5D3_9APIA|nr:hypothetical protein POM88_025493 [Heracleum sosnowskyi]